MIKISGSLIPKRLQDGFVDLMTPVIKILVKLDVKPNTVTVSGVVITLFSAVAFIMGHLRLGGFLILFGGFFDVIDGALARSCNKETRFGALFDSTIDRYSEFIMFFGIVAYFISVQDYLSSIAIFLALVGSLMVSYTRARAEGLGFDAKVGLMQRPERILFIGLGALIHPVALKFSIWLIAVFANYTAAQRIRYVYKQDFANHEQER
jgi:CDP-diacylglycerol--glycerol-3-phosphate 3-phosphatidyltransferase